MIVEPSYSDTKLHKHNMLHIFIGRKILNIHIANKEYDGNIILLKSNVLHKAPNGKIDYLLLVDPSSTLAMQIRRLIGNGEFAKSFKNGLDSIKIEEKKSDSEIVSEIENTLHTIGITMDNKIVMDERIVALIADIRAYKHLGKKLIDIAREYHYSESWLTHLFKREVGVSLKSYLLLRQMEYVWQEVYKGKSITVASLEAGFASSSHFAAICKKTTGISISSAI